MIPRILTPALIAPLLFAHVAIAAPETHPDTSGAEWKPLFAADLSDTTSVKGVWSVKDDVLTASADQCIWTKDTYENFQLDLEFKTAPGTNSGVIIYCTDTKKWIPHSVEIQLADQFAKKWAKAAPTWHCGGIFGHLAPTEQVVRKPGEWNRLTITARGQHIRVLLNGTLTADMDMAKWTSAKKNPDGSPIPPWLSTPFATMPTKGRIGLQGKHGDAPVWFRNVKIKQLAQPGQSPKPAASK